MAGFDSRIVVLFFVMFIALGIYNVIMGRRRQQRTQLQGQRLPWYKNVGILTGIEFIVLALTFLLNLAISYHWIPASMNSIAIPIYLIVLLVSGFLAGVVIYQAMRTSRRVRQAQLARSQEATRDQSSDSVHASKDRAATLQKRRERRQKAAAARRRRAGRA